MAEYQVDTILNFFNHNPFYELLTREAKRNSLSLEQYQLLQLIGDLGQASVSVIADNLGISRAAISRRGWELQEQGLAMEVRSLDDRRRRILQLTTEGKALLDHVSERYSNLIQKIAAQMGEERWSRFNRELIDFGEVSGLVNQRDLTNQT